MKKTGHLLVTDLTSGGLTKAQRFFLLTGSILPDILVHTYLKGHTWLGSFEDNCKRMRKLAEKGTYNWYSCLILGYILHYVEDYFTYPHNIGFTGSLAEHCQYEKEMLLYLQSELENEIIFKENDSILSSDMLCCYLHGLHSEYMRAKQCFENDSKYAVVAVQQAAVYFFRVFQRNQETKKLNRQTAVVLSNYFFSQRKGGRI